MNCDCINRIDDRLREKNLKLTGYAFIMPNFEPRFTIATQWVDRNKAPKGQKRNPTSMFVSHCPFCGKPVKKAKNPRDYEQRHRPG